MSNKEPQAAHPQGTASNLATGGIMGHEVMEVLGALSAREEELKKWLADHADEISPQAHLDANSREQVYWRYGYLIALRDALNLIQTKAISQTPCSVGTSN
jgi:hypothetical protein